MLPDDFVTEDRRIADRRKWRSVDDELPDDGVECLCLYWSPHTKTWQYILDERKKGAWLSDVEGEENIRHWKYLPEPPK